MCISTVPCTTYGKECGKLEYGKCATKSLCCNPEQCVEDETCANGFEDSKEQLYDEEKKILKELNVLLKQRKQQSKQDK